MTNQYSSRHTNMPSTIFKPTCVGPGCRHPVCVVTSVSTSLEDHIAYCACHWQAHCNVLEKEAVQRMMHREPHG